MPSNASPVPTTPLVPTRGASWPPAIDATAIEIATGRIRTPVPSAE